MNQNTKCTQQEMNNYYKYIYFDIIYLRGMVLTVLICRFIKKHMQAHTLEAKTMKACMPICMTFNI